MRAFLLGSGAREPDGGIGHDIIEPQTGNFHGRPDVEGGRRRTRGDFGPRH